MWVFWKLALVSLRCCFHQATEIRSQDNSNHGYISTVGAMGATYTLPWPYSHVYVCTKSAAAKTKPISSAGTLFVHWEVLLVLTLQNWLQGCQLIVWVAMRKWFLLFFFSDRDPGGSSVVSVPLLHVGHPQGSDLNAAPEHTYLSQKEWGT